MTTERTVMPRSEAAKRIYTGGSASYGHALNSYYARRDARLNAKGDREGLEVSQRERTQLEAFAKARGMSSEDLHAALSVVLEHETFPRSPEALTQRLAQTKEALRLEHGGHEQSQAAIHKFVAFSEALAKEVPTLAHRANQTGAAQHPDLVRIGAQYAPVSNTEVK